MDFFGKVLDSNLVDSGFFFEEKFWSQVYVSA